MARPKYEKGDDTAREKLEAAFWAALKEGSYENISVVGLCRAAGVNKNTFYYHFANVDALACAAAETLFDPEFVFVAIGAMREDVQVPDDLSRSEFTEKLDKLCLLADDKASPRLRQMLRTAVVGMWGTELGIDVDALDLRDRASLEFVLGGFLGVLSFRAREGNGFSFADIWGAGYLPHAFDIVGDLRKGR